MQTLPGHQNSNAEGEEDHSQRATMATADRTPAMLDCGDVNADVAELDCGRPVDDAPPAPVEPAPEPGPEPEP